MYAITSNRTALGIFDAVAHWVVLGGVAVVMSLSIVGFSA